MISLSMIKIYFTTLVYFYIIDTIGIQTFVLKLYNKNLPENLKINFDLTSAIIFYLIFVLGLVYFVVAPLKNAPLISVVIPALISTFIAVFKDTSLVFVLALTDLLQVGRIIPEQDPEFFGKALEALSVVAFLFWIVSMALSNLSTRVERSMGIGTR